MTMKIVGICVLHWLEEEQSESDEGHEEKRTKSEVIADFPGDPV